MSATKEIVSIYLEKESTINILLALLSSNSSYTDELQKVAENIVNRTEVSNDT